MTPWLIAALLLALVLLAIEDCCRREWRRSFRFERQRVQAVTPAPPVRNEYEIERAVDHRGSVRHWTPPVGGIEHLKGTR